MSEYGTVYRCVDENGETVYVGVTLWPCSRFSAHARQSPWWESVYRIELEHHPNRDVALVREAQLIEELSPRENKQPGTRMTEAELRERREEREAHRAELNAHVAFQWKWGGRYPVDDLRCGHCGWEGESVPKGMRLEECECPGCGIKALTGRPRAADPERDAA